MGETAGSFSIEEPYVVQGLLQSFVTYQEQALIIL